MSDMNLENYEPKPEDLQRLRGLRPIDDDFMRVMFSDNIPLAQYVLRVIMQKPDLEVESLETQKDMKRLLGGRSVCLDVYASDSTHKKYDIEIQRSDRGAQPQRARYLSGVMDIENLKADEDFDNLPDTYTIFITETDFFGAGQPFYQIERINLTLNTAFGDGEHILYVNGAYRDGREGGGETEISKLMHDFSCSDPEDMKTDLMRETAEKYKNSPEGVKIVCKVMEDMRNEAVDAANLKRIRAIMENLRLSLQQTLDVMGFTDEEKKKYAKLV